MPRARRKKRGSLSKPWRTILKKANTLPAGGLADAFDAGIILRIATLWLAGFAGALAFLG
jgi:hypothetical protein